MTSSSLIPSARTLFPRSVHSRVPGVRAPAPPWKMQSGPGHSGSEMFITFVERLGAGHRGKRAGPPLTLTTAHELKASMTAPLGAARGCNADATSTSALQA